MTNKNEIKDFKGELKNKKDAARFLVKIWSDFGAC